MKGFSKTVSIIIPTHNRRDSLWRLLEKLCVQSYPSDLTEVIVIADGCIDNTVSLLKTIRTPFPLIYRELPGKGAAAARNLGASLASSSILLFIDDDIEPDNGLVEGHVRAHDAENTVVIGYLPIETYGSRAFYFLHLRDWWETKYFKMQSGSHRFSYEDLLSGNFSVSRSLFANVGGFNEELRCREDYELGARLIKEDAKFRFEKKAVAYHRDEDNNFRISFRRKRMEGQGDWKFFLCHPELLGNLRLNMCRNPDRFTRRYLYFLVFSAPFLGKIGAALVFWILQMMEFGKMRKKWVRLMIRLQHYWYLRGVADIVKTRNALEYLTGIPDSKTPVPGTIEIDLKYGIRMAELQVDALRPASVRLLYGKQYIGTIPARAGSEALRGSQLAGFVTENLWMETIQAMVAEDAGRKNDPKEQDYESGLAEGLKNMQMGESANVQIQKQPAGKKCDDVIM